MRSEHEYVFIIDTLNSWFEWTGTGSDTKLIVVNSFAIAQLNSLSISINRFSAGGKNVINISILQEIIASELELCSITGWEDFG